MKDRQSYVYHNMARDERNRRRRAYKRLDPHDREVVTKSMASLKRWGGLSDMAAFDLLAAIGEFLAKGLTE